MTSEPNPTDALERRLQAWDVPEPPANLTDRILGANAEALRELAEPTTDTPQPEQDPPIMLPTDPHTRSSLRPLWTATFIGFAAAAALILAFVAGRQSTERAELTPAMPKVEVSVTTPVAAPMPTPEPPPKPEVPVVTETPEPPPAAEAPAPPAKPKRPKRPKKPEPIEDAFDDLESPALKNPFAKPSDALLRIGTETGVGPATVYLDGEKLGMTPLARVRVSAGEHEIRFEWPDYSSVKTVRVKKGEALLVRGSKD